MDAAPSGQVRIAVLTRDALRGQMPSVHAICARWGVSKATAVRSRRIARAVAEDRVRSLPVAWTAGR